MNAPLPRVGKLSGACHHCGLPSGEDAYCCLGCRAAHAFLRGQGLERFYALRGKRGVAVGDASDAFFDPAFDALVLSAEQGGSLRVDIQGVHCAGCIWLIEELFCRREGARIDIDPTHGTAVLHVRAGFELDGFRTDLAGLGYRLGCPGQATTSRLSDELLLRMGICIALAGNVMFYAIAIYLGLDDSPLRDFLDRAAFGAGVLSVGVGGSVFVRSAIRGLRRGVVGMDLPVAVGIILAFVASSVRYLVYDDAGFVDTLTVFVALMLVGRFLQERALERARQRLLDADGKERLYTRRVEQGIVRTRRCEQIEPGDVLHFGCGDLVPVDAVTDSRSRFSLDWITGEQGERWFDAGETVPAGAFSASDVGVRARALSRFEESIVPRLLRETRAAQPGDIAWWARVGSGYVLLVLGASALGGVGWLALGDAKAALDVATAILVVTCPCAFGIALPLARELAHAELRRSGLHVRTGGFLERLSEVRRVVFDKTGTLTTGAMELEQPIACTGESRTLLASLAQASVHPRSRVIADALPDVPPYPQAMEVRGRGIEAVIDGKTYRFGLPSWVAPRACTQGEDIAFGVDGALIESFRTTERLRKDAAAEVASLSKCLEVVIASGDRQQRVSALAKRLGVKEAHGGMRPDDKAEFIRAHRPEQTLMVGDGLNDHLALLEAQCAGTPVVERPFVASRCDFYLTSPGLAPIGRAFATADWLRTTQRRLLFIALSYNVVAVSLALAGLVAPWVAAVLMPASSLLTLGFVALRGRSLNPQPQPSEPRPLASPSSAAVAAGAQA